MKALVVILAGALVASIAIFAVPGVGSSEEPSNTTTTTTSEEATEVAEVEDQDAINERLADQYVEHSPKLVAENCRYAQVIGEARAEQIGIRILGPQIMRNDGEPSEVIELIYDHC